MIIMHLIQGRLSDHFTYLITTDFQTGNWGVSFCSLTGSPPPLDKVTLMTYVTDWA